MFGFKLINLAETVSSASVSVTKMIHSCLGKYVNAIHQRLVVFGMNIIPTFNQYPHCRMNINSVIILVGLSVRWRDQIINITLISYNLTHLTSPNQPGPLSLVQECRGSALIHPEMLLRQLSYAIKNQLVASKAPY